MTLSFEFLDLFLKASGSPAHYLLIESRPKHEVGQSGGIARMLTQIVVKDSERTYTVVTKCQTCLIVTRSKLNVSELQQTLAAGVLQYVCTWCGQTRTQSLTDDFKARITEIVNTL